MLQYILGWYFCGTKLSQLFPCLKRGKILRLGMHQIRSNPTKSHRYCISAVLQQLSASPTCYWASRKGQKTTFDFVVCSTFHKLCVETHTSGNPTPGEVGKGANTSPAGQMLNPPPHNYLIFSFLLVCFVFLFSTQLFNIGYCYEKCKSPIIHLVI